MANLRDVENLHSSTSLTNVTWAGDEMRSKWESVCSVMMRLCRNQHKLVLLFLLPLLWAESEFEFDSDSEYTRMPNDLTSPLLDFEIASTLWLLGKTWGI